MFDFPDAPAVGAKYTSGSASYTWDGVSWNIESSPTAADYVLKAGDTMTGPLTVRVGGTDRFNVHNTGVQLTGYMWFNDNANWIGKEDPTTIRLNIVSGSIFSAGILGLGAFYEKLRVHDGGVTVWGTFTDNALLADVLTADGGINVGDALALCFTKIKQLEAEVQLLKRSRR
jgi:hypothetical protein